MKIVRVLPDGIDMNFFVPVKQSAPKRECEQVARERNTVANEMQLSAAAAVIDCFLKRDYLMLSLCVTLLEGLA